MFHNVETRVIGLQMPLNVEGNEDATMEVKVEETATKKDPIQKKKKKNNIWNMDAHIVTSIQKL